ncbi:hypothetical protein GALL_511470 [mine drainage metagenome]|uniref:Uncharacterized protein n=1 Tax=mine drainage metagenome TaxID=410659 RepID=A0A1J5PIB2_9ZZZZ
MAQARAPADAWFDSVRLRLMRSGVVFTPASSAPGKPLPSVPITAQGLPSSVIACAIHWLTEVLPLVPVTPTSSSRSEGRP